MNDYELVRLSSLLSRFDESSVQRILGSFEPVTESSVDSFLTKNSIGMEK